jgi:hypothetical protein
MLIVDFDYFLFFNIFSLLFDLPPNSHGTPTDPSGHAMCPGTPVQNRWIRGMLNSWAGDDSLLLKRKDTHIRVYPRKYLSHREFDWVIISHTLLSIDSTVDDKGTLTKYLFVKARQLVHLTYHSASSHFCS